ncbi:MAG TPA: M23 family peptidase [Ruminococcaceae bacterium]|nr:M23 family peptidase [Oscillospiraceae bacterium]
MKIHPHKKNIKAILFAALIGLTILFTASTIQKNSVAHAANSTIKWANFDVPTSAMQDALKADINTHTSANPVHFVDSLAYLAAKYSGNWKQYKNADLSAFTQKRKNGESIENLTQNLKGYIYYNQVYTAALGNAVGEYATGAGNQYTENYGLKLSCPIAAGYGYSHYDDFGNSRSFGFARRHLGNDIMGTVGTPVCAVEGGYIEELGWNKYGGWRIGIRSFDKKRYYYYAHLRKGHPFQTGLVKNEAVGSGEVIGYLGMTGYSDKEDINGMQKPHLHFGMQLIFDDAPRESNNELWIDVYHIVDFLAQNRSQVSKNGKDYHSVKDLLDMRYLLYYD